MAGNRAVAYMGPRKLEIHNLDYPKLVDPRGKKCEHGVILKLLVTNICGSDQHIYRGRFPAPSGMILGHENAGEVIVAFPAFIPGATRRPGMESRSKASTALISARHGSSLRA